MKQRVLFLFLVLLGLGQAMNVRADKFMQTASNYTCMQMGIDKLRFTLPTQYDGTINEGVQEGHVYVKVDNGPEQEVFEWKCDDYSDLDDGYWIKAYQPGTFQLQGQAKSWTIFTANDNWVKYNLKPDDTNKDHYTTTVDWVIPRELRGHNLKLTVWVHVNWSGAGDWHVPDAYSHRQMLDWDAPEAAATNAELADFMLAYDQKQVGKIMSVYSINAKSVNWARLHYTDAVTGAQGTVALEKKLVGFAYLPMTRSYTNVYLEASVKDSENYDVIVTSEPITASMMHVPTNLSVKLSPEGHALLTWKVNAPQQDDMEEYDQFEIQRNVNGTDITSGWQSCGSVTFESGADTYTFEDPDLLDLYKGIPVAYRVRRTSTGVWAWSDGSGGVQTVLSAIPVLPQIENATVLRSSTWDDETHVADFSFSYGPSQDDQGHIIIRSAEDFKAFAQRVNNGDVELTAIMAADIDLGDSQVMVGTPAHPFSGLFDGNGHTLTVAYNSTSGDVAPFSQISGAHITNLTVHGSATSSTRFVGGLVGRVTGTGISEIENCRVSVAVGSSVNGEAVNGGFVARCSTGTLRIKNCRFDGQLLGATCYNNGGFVGWTDTRVEMTNCLFAPSQITTKHDGCKTFARTRYASDLILTNCNYTVSYEHDEKVTIDGKEYYILRNNADWQKFSTAVQNGNGNADVNAIMVADIAVTESVGRTESSPYRGIFDGNGHTLEVSLYDEKTKFLAPFMNIKGASFKNLRVTGSVNGGLHASGLAGQSINGSTNRFDNVRVSVTITCNKIDTNGPHSGGFIGHNNVSTFYINNCLFDGRMISTSFNDSYAGAFVGWGDGYWFFEHNYENGTYVNYLHAGLNYRSTNAWGGSWTSYSVHNWGEMYSSDNRNATDAAQVVSKLGSQWALEDDAAVPLMTTQQVGQGYNVASKSISELAQLMGGQWHADGGELVPLSVTREQSIYSPSLWDSRAKLQLRINMHGENGVDSNIIDLSSNDDVFKNHRFSQELSRKCVEYSFDLIVRQGTSPLKITNTDNDSLVVAVKKMDVGDLANYRFVNGDSIVSLNAVTKQSSVELTWTTTGGDHDFYRVMRKDKMNQEAKWDEIATDLITQYYEDTSVLSQHVYLYRVESVYQCEGTHVSTVETEGFCEKTGMINGYVRLADGTAMAGVTVRVEPLDSVTKKIATQPYWECQTDSTGYYEVKGLPFRETGRYSVYVPVDGTGSSFTGGGTVTFTPSSNWTQNFNLYQDEYVVYSGNVYYRDTSIPVAGVSFLMDGHPLYNANRQLIETDTQGAFELSIPKGLHTVQAVKQGHYFAADGFLIDEDAVENPTLYNFTENVPSVYIWDSTTVVLRGRVVGGDIQGSKPLGQSLSTNNLGDSIKIVMQLEGDNTSWLIRKQNDDTVKSANYDVHFGHEDKDVANINVTRHTLTIYPDKVTGEYQLDLHPAKYKIIEVSAQGYATLFQAGKVGETIDLTFKERGDTCEYNRIYHSVPDVDVTQVNSGNDQYFGFKEYTASNTIGDTEVVTVWYKDSLGVEHYAFGYPVFMANSPYGWLLQACEKYRYNNNPNAEPDIVNLSGGVVKIQNALTTDSKTSEMVVKLDENGGGQYVFVPDNPTFVLEDDMALKTVSITLEYDGTYYDIKPFNGDLLKGYVMAVKANKEGQYTVACDVPQLVDILRDPPGGGSSSYIETGSKMSCSYNLSLDASIGAKLTNTTIKNKSIVLNGAVVAPEGTGTFSGTITDTDSRNDFVFTAVTNYTGNWTWSYNYDVTTRIQTSTGKKWVGGKADLFIGHNENIILYRGMAVRAIPEKQYQLMKTHEGGSFQLNNDDGTTTTVKVPVGTMKVLATGVDKDKKPVYLVRDEVIVAGPKVKSTFVHSQNYIENELLPALMKLRNSMIYSKDTLLDFQALANQYDKVFYQSNVAEDDPIFGSDSPSAYTAYFPEYSTTVHSDSVKALNQEMYVWLNYLALNEMEKLNVSPDRRVDNFDFDGAANIQYSENFSVSRTDAGQVKYPIIQSFDLMGTFPSLFSTFEKLKDLNKIDKFTEDPNPQEASYRTEANGSKSLIVAVGGSGFSLKWTPVLAYTINGKNTQSETFSKKIGFTLSTASKSSLNVDVYRTKKNYWDIDKSAHKNEYNHIKLDTILLVTKDNLFMQHMGNTYQPNYSSWTVYSNFVFRTRAGVTCQPYEDARKTKWYQPGTVVDVATVPADKPHIWIDQPVVSNVPFDEPARFTLHIANETDFPDRATMAFNYYLLPTSNPKGATVCVDGKPLSSGGEGITLFPILASDGKHNVFTKEVTVYPSTAYDYEDLTICLVDPEDASRVFSTKLSAHFIPSAGKVNVSTPGDHWVVNTESPYDGKRKGWYLPVRIDGFDVNFPGFDHIELQYKLSTQGDKDWVSTCSFYADDELRAKASGVTDSIPSNGIIIAPFFGEKDPVEQYYDIRAVNYCRYAGGYLTRSSAILTGIKDTRLPELFGTPQPVNGILDIGEDIMLSFSEPIAGNYLSKINNFELLGTPVNNDISTSTSLSFADGAMSLSQGTRNFDGKSITVDVMLNPVDNQRDMFVFTHGSEDRSLHFGLTADRRLKATINGQTVESDSVVPFHNTLRQVAYVLDQSGTDMQVNFFDGSKPIGSKKLPGKYNGSSVLLLGTDIKSDDYYYTGDMLEFRLWNRALTGPQIDMYSRKRLTGYESGLLDYYPMNEGKGDYCYDKAAGSMDLHNYNTTWKRPSGISMKFDGTEGLRMNPKPFERSADHDYTLMFWFRTKDANATFLSNGPATKDDADQISIGLKDYGIYVRSAGFERNLSKSYSDGDWHHFAMTVSRSRNAANVYVDEKLIDAFAADSVQGIVGDHVALGATYPDKNTPANVLTGNIDEVGLFASVLPLNLLTEYSTHTPLGTSSPLLVYLDFGKSEHSDNNTMRLQPTGVSVKRYTDSQGNVLERRDTLIAVIDERFVDRANQAPIANVAQLKNLNFNYVTDGQNLLVNIKEPEYLIEKTNVYLTVKEVPDLRGNLMASPVTMNVYVYRNPLRWSVKSINHHIHYGESLSFDVTVKNLSGVRQDFELLDLPVWITASQTSGVIDALDEQTITFTVTPYINIGTYTEQVSLISGNGMCEPLPITLNVRGNEPTWAVSDRLLQLNQTMMMVSRVKLNGMVDNSPEDIVGVFDDDFQTLGTAHIEVDKTANSNEALAYVTIYGYTNSDGSKPRLNFRLYHASTGKVHTLKPEDETQYTFVRDTVIGTASSPIVLEDNYSDVQTIRLKKGWNWVTFCNEVYDTTVKQFLDGSNVWEVGDIVMTVNGTTTQQWSCRQNKESKRGYKWDHENDIMTIVPQQMYYVYSCSDKVVVFEGLYTYPSITVEKGWNRIGYTSPINLPIAQAMNDYAEYASDGDVVKSQEGFAVASQTSNGIVWKGTLQFMEAGKGYMLKRQADSQVSFLYPWYFTGSRYDGGVSNQLKQPNVNTISTMNIVASVSGVEVEPGDQLVVYCGAERMTEAQADDEQLYYLNIGADSKPDQTLTFVIERDGEVVAMTGSRIRYESDALLGTPDEPTDISFVSLSDMPHDGKWYTISGVQLAKKPGKSGIYIHNGKAVTVKAGTNHSHE